jgi:hypothetical protein
MSEYIVEEFNSVECDFTGKPFCEYDRREDIIRCKDCDHFDEFSLLPGFSTPLCMLLNRMTDQMYFCAWAEPKEES